MGGEYLAKRAVGSRLNQKTAVEIMFSSVRGIHVMEPMIPGFFRVSLRLSEKTCPGENDEC